MEGVVADTGVELITSLANQIIKDVVIPSDASQVSELIVLRIRVMPKVVTIES